MEKGLRVCWLDMKLGVQYSSPPEPVTLVDLQVQEGGGLL